MAETVVKHFSEVSAHLALNANGHDHPGEVDALHALGDAVERILKVNAQPRLDQRPIELRGDRRFALANDSVDGLGHRVASGEAASHELQSVREGGHKRLAPLPCLVGQVRPREDDSEDERHQRQQDPSVGDEEGDQSGTERDPDMNQQPLGWLEGDGGRLELGAKGGLEVTLGDDTAGELNSASGHLGVAQNSRLLLFDRSSSAEGVDREASPDATAWLRSGSVLAEMAT